MMTLIFIFGIMLVFMIFACIFTHVYILTGRKLFDVLSWLSLGVSTIAVLFFGLRALSLPSTLVTYEVVDTNNKKYELKGYCDENDMYCTTEDEKKTIKVISFEIIGGE